MDRDELRELLCSIGPCLERQKLESLMRASRENGADIVMHDFDRMMRSTISGAMPTSSSDTITPLGGGSGFNPGNRIGDAESPVGASAWMQRVCNPGFRAALGVSALAVPAIRVVLTGVNAYCAGNASYEQIRDIIATFYQEQSGDSVSLPALPDAASNALMGAGLLANNERRGAFAGASTPEAAANELLDTTNASSVIQHGLGLPAVRQGTGAVMPHLYSDGAQNVAAWTLLAGLGTGTYANVTPMFTDSSDRARALATDSDHNGVVGRHEAAVLAAGIMGGHA